MSTGATGAEVGKMSIYWRREVHELARSAYVADLDATPAGPEFFVDWMRRALEEHAELSPKARAKLADKLPEISDHRSFNQTYPMPADLIAQVEAAVAQDRRELGRVASRSAFALDAFLVAVAKARGRRGGTLPPPPNQLPNRRPRRFG